LRSTGRWCGDGRYPDIVEGQEIADVAASYTTRADEADSHLRHLL
jgi:hypothetical protein